MPGYHPGRLRSIKVLCLAALFLEGAPATRAATGEEAALPQTPGATTLRRTYATPRPSPRAVMATRAGSPAGHVANGMPASSATLGLTSLSGVPGASSVTSMAWPPMAYGASVLGRSAVGPSAATPSFRARGFRFSRLDTGLLAGGVGLVGTAGLLEARQRAVPRAGLDPGSIPFAWDRDAVRPRNDEPRAAGGALLLGTLVYPTLSTLLTAGPGGRDAPTGRVLAEQAEAILLAEGVAFVLKKVVSRPRPYAHMPVYERSETGPEWATSEGTFESFPSGHATIAWTSAGLGVSSLAVRRPDLPPVVHFLNGVLGGAIATMASQTRVDAGLHFPTDVVAGAVVGAAIGGGIPLLRARGPRDPRTGRALRWGWLGAGSACAAAILLTPSSSPWIDD